MNTNKENDGAARRRLPRHVTVSLRRRMMAKIRDSPLMLGDGEGVYV